ncbi:GNAT family N-acetyltransferase [Demequina salsinemoris]|uniref:GNAT family N-acetyltransferase n=1 Tax=Demequina salsinemoris TaxID=577470 RepID=UPI0007847DC5|nr:GNAT family N-acetyltransferase [Demequina salsinemoris]
MGIRPVSDGDHAQIARICLLTGRQGEDATGVFCDDTVLSDVYATPYLHGPGGFCLVWEADGAAGEAEARGYVLGTSDTESFQRWFVEEWWPERAPLHQPCHVPDAWLLSAAADPERMLVPRLGEFPAHLHIDLLPDQQGRGAGRALIEAACGLLTMRDVPGVHLVAETANENAQAFYPRVGFDAVARDDATVTWGRRLTDLRFAK